MFVGVQQQDFLDTLLTKYNMMIPVAPLQIVDRWQGNEAKEDILEKIIGENTLRSVAFLAQGLHVAKSVAYVGVNKPVKPWSGTGFLVTPDLLMTNYHVISNVSLLPVTIFRFNYEENFNGEAQQVKEYRAKVNGIFQANQILDYAIIQLEQEPGYEWGWLPLQIKDVKKDERVNIIQHPGGLPKQVSLQNNYVEYVGGNVIQYVTSTLPGSSGAPVLNDGWEVIALHHAGGSLREPTTQRTYFRNEGILISKILNDIPDELKQRIYSAISN